MKITFIGTSHGAPSAERFCSCTMIESGGAIYFIDAGAPVVDCLLRRKKDINKLRAIFTTHAHSDHTVGMLHVAGLINWFYHEASVEIYVTEQAHIDATKNWLSTAGDGDVDEEGRVHFKLSSAGVIYEDENIKVEYIPTSHGHCSYAILVTEGEKRVLFGGDLSGKLRRNDLPKLICEEIDGFVCEMAHFGMEHLAPYLDNCRAKRVFFTHVYPLDKYEDIEKAKGKYEFEIFTPDDFDEYIFN